MTDSDLAGFATTIRAPHRVTQTILYDPELNARGVYGNCLQAAFASLLGMPLEAVPHFVAFGSWDTALALWLADIGLIRVVEERDSIPTTGACLVSGRSVRGVRHTVVAIDGEVWDPHPSRDGLATVDEVWWLEPRREPVTTISNISTQRQNRTLTEVTPIPLDPAPRDPRLFQQPGSRGAAMSPTRRQRAIARRYDSEPVP